MRCPVFIALAVAAACRQPPATTADAPAPRPPEASAPIDARPTTDAAHADAVHTDAAAAHLAPPDAGSADAGAPRRRVSITATGDIDIVPRIVEFAEQHREHGRLEWLIARAAIAIPPHDVAVANLETPLSAVHHPVGGRLEVLDAPPGFAHDLSRAGFDAMFVANNHAYDQTADGLDETLDALHGAGMVGVGAARGEDAVYAPVVLERDGVRVALLGFTVRTNDGPGPNANGVRVARIEEPARALAAVTAARANADVVVVGVHWSRDFVNAISDAQRSLARRLVQAGADLVLGTGPHVIQRVERVPSARGEAVVAFSLGDFLTLHGSRYRVGAMVRPAHTTPVLDDPGTRDGVMFRATFELPEPGTVRVVSLSAVALWTVYSEDGIRVLPLRGTDDDVRTERLAAITAAIGPNVRVRP